MQGKTRSMATHKRRHRCSISTRETLIRIKDAPPNTWATVHRRDVVTLSELARRGFHLVDMSSEV
jgi:hypothetical protein